MLNKDEEFKKIKNTEEKLIYLYKEIFWMSQKLSEIHDHQKELGQLFVNFLQKAEKKKSS